MTKLSTSQVKAIKQVFDKAPIKKMLVIQGHISTLFELSYLIGNKNDYSIITNNLKQII